MEVFDVNPKKKILGGPSTIKARSAVAALSETSKPDFTAAKAANKTRTIADLNPMKKDPKPTIAPSTTRHAAATAASKNTIGYAKGRATTTNAAPRKPLSNVTKPAPFSATTRRPTSAANTHARAPSASSTASTAPRSRREFSRSSSTSTQATLVASPQQEEPFRTAEDVEREMERLFLQDSDGEEADVWMNNFASQLDGADPFDEDLEGFQMTLPEGL